MCDHLLQLSKSPESDSFLQAPFCFFLWPASSASLPPSSVPSLLPPQPGEGGNWGKSQKHLRNPDALRLARVRWFRKTPCGADSRASNAKQILNTDLLYAAGGDPLTCAVKYTCIGGKQEIRRQRMNRDRLKSHSHIPPPLSLSRSPESSIYYTCEVSCLTAYLGREQLSHLPASRLNDCCLKTFPSNLFLIQVNHYEEPKNPTC